jgi:3-hydroxyacyl-CoA dehydrogenase
MGVYSPPVIHALKEYLATGKSKRIVLTSEGRVFSAGFDIKFLIDRIAAEDYDAIEAALAEFQGLGLALREIPSCAAVFGTCLGGGDEMASTCSLIAANPETQIGLPESRVGVIPGGGGIALLRTRFQENAKTVVECAKLLVTGTVARNADEARKRGLLRREDPTVYHPDRLFTEAKRLALAAKPLGVPEWKPVVGPLLAMIERTQDELTKSGELTEHDGKIGDRIKFALAKSDSFEDALTKERAGFIELVKDTMSQARLRHMVESGKPLRN